MQMYTKILILTNNFSFCNSSRSEEYEESFRIKNR